MYVSISMNNIKKNVLVMKNEMKIDFLVLFSRQSAVIFLWRLPTFLLPFSRLTFIVIENLNYSLWLFLEHDGDGLKKGFCRLNEIKIFYGWNFQEKIEKKLLSFCENLWGITRVSMWIYEGYKQHCRFKDIELGHQTITQ